MLNDIVKKPFFHHKSVYTKMDKDIYLRLFKRSFDIVFALLTLIILSPVYIIISILVKINLGKPIIFKQIRPGKNEKLFTLYKFRTMIDRCDEKGNLMSDSERMTKFGKLLRESSLDELPEAFNILKGDMSVVGPRPQLIKDMVFMSKKQRIRHLVRPGLTGLAQINGRNEITWDVKLKYDLKYIRKITFCKDLKIIVITILKVLKREGISEKGMETAIDFGDYLLKHGKVNKEYYDKKKIEAKRILAYKQENKYKI